MVAFAINSHTSLRGVEKLLWFDFFFHQFLGVIAIKEPNWAGVPKDSRTLYSSAGQKNTRCLIKAIRTQNQDKQGKIYQKETRNKRGDSLLCIYSSSGLDKLHNCSTCSNT